VTEWGLGGIWSVLGESWILFMFFMPMDDVLIILSRFIGL
jgi:hypothetical protein